MEEYLTGPSSKKANRIKSYFTTAILITDFYVKLRTTFAHDNQGKKKTFNLVLSLLSLLF